MQTLLLFAALLMAGAALALVLAEHFREHVQGQAYAPTRKAHPPAPGGFLQPPPPLVDGAESAQRK